MPDSVTGQDAAAAAIAAATGEPLNGTPTVDEEGEHPPQYDPNAFAREAEENEAALAAQGAIQPNPQGTEGIVDREREERAAHAVNDPLRGLTSIQRATYEKFGTLPPGITPPPAAPNPQMANMMQAMMQMMAAATGQNVDALGLPGLPGEMPSPVKQTGEFILVSTWGGRVYVQKFTDLRVLQGFVQKAPGEKRIFRADPGATDLQEINGQGLDVVR